MGRIEENEMVGHSIPHFHNDGGHATVRIGVREFMCTGANPPHDHPHIFLDMGHDVEKICPYCSTHYQYDPSLSANQTNPEGCAVTGHVA